MHTRSQEVPTARSGAFLIACALAAAGVVFAVTSLIHAPGAQSYNFGTTYEDMSRQPFAFVGLFPHRILMPLLAVVLQMGGDRFYLLSHALCVLMLALTFYFCCKAGVRRLDALLITTAIGFTSTLQVYKSHVGYSDPLIFTLLLLGVMTARNAWLFWITIGLNVFNHEMSLFFLPWLLFVRHRTGTASRAGDGTGLALTLIAYVAFRLYVGEHAAEQELTISSYAQKHYLPLGFLGLSVLGVLASVVQFGPLLALPAWSAARNGGLFDSRSLLLFTLLLFAMFTVAHDAYRLVNFLFLPVVVASIAFLRSGARRLVYSLLTVAMIALYAGLNTPVATALGRVMFQECFVNIEMSRMATCVLPKLWFVFLPATLAFAALVAVGWRLGRRRPDHVV